ncbi:MAG: acetolactate synthase, partial [Planctomycetaceae bacterium]
SSPRSRITLSSLMSAELNVEYVYPMLYRRGGRGSIALYGAETEELLRVIRERGLELVTEDDLIHPDEFG